MVTFLVHPPPNAQVFPELVADVCLVHAENESFVEDGFICRYTGRDTVRPAVYKVTLKFDARWGGYTGYLKSISIGASSFANHGPTHPSVTPFRLKLEAAGVFRAYSVPFLNVSRVHPGTVDFLASPASSE